MAVTTDILQSWRGPGAKVQSLLARGRSEPFAFTLLVVFLILGFVARWPGAARVTALQPEIPVYPQLVAAGLGLLATIPFWYGLAALSHLAARAMGGQGDWYGARIALFWSLVAVSPLMLLVGLVAGMIGPGVQLSAVGVITFGAFVIHWLLALRAVEGA